MHSIRRRITIRILLGLAVLWVAAGTGIFFTVRHSLLKSIDAQLAIDARLVRFAARPESGEARSGGGRRLQDRMPAYDAPDGNAFFQTWTLDGESAEKSVSLGSDAFPFPGSNTATDPRFSSHRLKDGRIIRTMTFRVAVGGKGKGRTKGRSSSGGTVFVLGQDTGAIRSTLTSVLGGIALIGLLVAAGATLLVRFGVMQGLRPLRKLGEETLLISAGNLEARFDATGAPAELEPVYARLNELIQRLETGFDRERQFSADLAHELRTPVAELRMLNEVALKWEDQAGAKTHQESLEIAGQLESTIETLLTLARCESGEAKPDRETIDLRKMIEDTAALHERAAADRGLQLRFHFPETPVSITAPPTFMRTILNNLLSNAVAYAPEGTVIDVTAEEEQCSFANEAPGLRQVDLENLFQRYWRKEASRSDASHVGLGLSLVAACAAASGLVVSPTLKNGRLHMQVQPAPATPPFSPDS